MQAKPKTRHLQVACALLLLAPLVARAQAAAPKPTIPALFLSDIHLDPFADPAKVARLNSAAASEWPAILAAPESPTHDTESAALQKACPVRGVDTPESLWLSTLAALRADAARSRFVTISGDLLAHQFDCKFKALLPDAAPGDYLAFTQKTVAYILSSLQASLPGVPVYLALGNNDSGCTDYALDATNDRFLAAVAPLAAAALPATLPASERQQAEHDFAAGGYYSAPLAGVPNTRILVLDDLFFSAKYTTCAGKPDPAPAAAQLAWLESQLADARNRHERIWVMGHIPPGIDPYGTAKKALNICLGGKPQMFLASDDLSDTLAAYSDVIRLAIFGHTHADEMRLLRLKAGSQYPATPVKVVASITPVNGNNPSFTLAKIDPASATLLDYTVVEASNQTGIAARWSPEYTYSTAYHQPAFNSAGLTRLILDFRKDSAGATPASRNYIASYSPNGPSTALLVLAWPQYVCSMDSSVDFAGCACPAANAAPQAGAKGGQ